MMPFNEVRHHPNFEQAKALWRHLLAEPSNFYSAMLLLQDHNGDCYYTTDPIYVVTKERYVTKVSVVTRTQSYKTLTLLGYTLVCKDKLSILPEKYEIVPGGGEDGSDLRIKLDQWFEISGGALHSNLNVLSGDQVIPTATITIANGMLD